MGELTTITPVKRGFIRFVPLSQIYLSGRKVSLKKVLK